MASKSPIDTGDRRINSWKEIAAYFGRDERTVKRWEKERGLPVHRIPGGSRGSVYALTSELSEWLEKGERVGALAGDEPAQLASGGGDSAAGAALVQKARRWWLSATALEAGGIGLVVLLALSAWFFVFRTRAAAIDSVAVLPFANADADTNAEYLSDGITESVINDLSQLPHIRVTPRSSAFRYKGREVDARTAANELHVRAIVTGRVSRHGDSIVVDAELIDGSSDSQIWGVQYTRKIGDMLLLQDEISQEISEKLRVRLTGDDKKRLAKRDTESVEAYELYLKGRYYWNKRTPDGLNEAAVYFQQATEKDPNYALAHAGLGDSYNLMSYYDVNAPRVTLPKAEAEVKKALEIDPELAEAHASFGRILGMYDHDWAGAEAEMHRALELNPNYVTAHQWYAMLLAFSGRMDEAKAEMRRAVEADPLSLIANDAEALIFFYAREYDRALEQYKSTLEMDANFLPSHREIGMVYEVRGEYKQAIAEFQRARELAPGDLHAIGWLGQAYARDGNRAEAQKLLDELQKRSRSGYVPAYSFAAIYAGLGDNDQAFASLAKACDERDDWVVKLKVDPLYDSLRADPRFQNALRCIGFAQ
jgi:TolB-like protein/Tfp pilus assembly protein PilF